MPQPRRFRLSPATANAADKITFLTSWYAQAEHGGFYQAKAAGLYEKAGLDVTIRMGGPQVNGLQLLLAGEGDIMMGYDFQVLNSIAKGIPVITIGTSFQKDLQGIMAHEHVKGLDDLKDKTILVATPGRTSWWPWMKRKYGLNDAQTQAYTFNLQPFFNDKNIVQQSYPSSEPFQAMQKGVPVKFFLMADNGYPPYGTTMVTTTKLVAEQARRGAALRARVDRGLEELSQGRSVAGQQADQGRQSEDERRADRVRHQAAQRARSRRRRRRQDHGHGHHHRSALEGDLRTDGAGRPAAGRHRLEEGLHDARS